MSDNQIYRFDIGRFDCLIIQDGTYTYPHPRDMFFVNAPKEKLNQALHKHNIDPNKWEEYVSPYPTIVIKTGDEVVLIDTGAGDLAPTTGDLQRNLKNTDIKPRDIDKVILTHAHPDHIGGCIDKNKDPMFPEAKYIMSKKEYDFWSSNPDLSNLKIGDEIKNLLLETPQNIFPHIKNQIELIDHESKTEITPGISTIPAPGHTPGHMAISIKSNNKQLLHIVDTVLHPIHINHPEWYGATDYNPTQLVETRKTLLDRSIKQKPLVFIYHFPIPGLGHITEKNQTMKWNPKEK